MGVVKLGPVTLHVTGDLRQGLPGYLERAGLLCAAVMYLCLALMTMLAAVAALPFLLLTGRMKHVGGGRFIRVR